MAAHMRGMHKEEGSRGSFLKLPKSSTVLSPCNAIVGFYIWDLESSFQNQFQDYISKDMPIIMQCTGVGKIITAIAVSHEECEAKKNLKFELSNNIDHLYLSNPFPNLYFLPTSFSTLIIIRKFCFPFLDHVSLDLFSTCKWN